MEGINRILPFSEYAWRECDSEIPQSEIHAQCLTPTMMFTYLNKSI